MLLLALDRPQRPVRWLRSFAEMARCSYSPEGDWQGDGWGVAWLGAEGRWHSRHSLAPLWQEEASFVSLPESRRWVCHARSASFPATRGVVAYNQPYLLGSTAFVFNGLLAGVRTPAPVPGRIGAQKIAHLVAENLEHRSLSRTLDWLQEYLNAHSRGVPA
ncbi:MAG TPA: hypothetical protein PKK12_10995, partial [Candidatus Aminicenantes bacterium]|nr:hypothetical protein [Candidatus Aminicenantes bacterium]